MADRNRLGKGLGAIFGDGVEDVLEEIQKGSHEAYGGVKTKLSVNDIRTNPYQPRRIFDEEKTWFIYPNLSERKCQRL